MKFCCSATQIIFPSGSRLDLVMNVREEYLGQLATENLVIAQDSGEETNTVMELLPTSFAIFSLENGLLPDGLLPGGLTTVRRFPL